ncbi:12320_t:CDS:2 [Rhizophagus irregularis]|nr:12320_t:CDS:2 [Rhizophagus irregularis]
MSMPDTNNNNSSGQEQSLEASVRIENSPGNGKDKVEEFNKIFSDRVKRVNEKAEGSTGKKTLETEVLPDKRNVLQPSRVR